MPQNARMNTREETTSVDRPERSKGPGLLIAIAVVVGILIVAWVVSSQIGGPPTPPVPAGTADGPMTPPVDEPPGPLDPPP